MEAKKEYIKLEKWQARFLITGIQIKLDDLQESLNALKKDTGLYEDEF